MMPPWVDRFGSGIAFAAGLALPFAFAPFGLTPLAVVLVALLFALWDRATPRRAAWLGFLFGFGAFAYGTHWLYVSLHDFGKASPFLAVPLMAALMALMALYTAGVGYAAVRLSRAGPVRWLLAAPALWVLAEWVRSWLLSGFPWLSLGYATTGSPLAGWIAPGGVFAASLAVAVSAGALRALLDRRARVYAAVALAAVWLGGAALTNVEWTRPTGQPLKIGIVQAAVPQDRKWLPEELVPTMRLYRDLTVRHWDRDLIVWPEAAIPALRSSIGDFYASMHSSARETDTALIVGIIEYRPDEDAFYNGVLGFDRGISSYYKRHLVPFGEYFPVPGFVREWMRLRNLPYSDYTAGSDDQAPLPIAGQLVAASICYEDVFGNELRMMLPQATLLVNVSNDAWFGETIAPHQHLQIARVRAIEAGRYLLRSTNTGISAVISPDGTVEQTIAQFETAVLTATVSPHAGATPYVRFGDWPVLLSAIAALGLGRALSRKLRAGGRE